MNRVARKPHPVGVPAIEVTHKVKFGKEAHPDKRNAEVRPALRVPRAARLLALAHRIDRMIRSEELKDWAEAARLIGITRARMTQIGNLLLLAPGIQEEILAIGPRMARNPVTERHFRQPALWAGWIQQLCSHNGTSADESEIQMEERRLEPN